jgi:hypothetical protein
VAASNIAVYSKTALSKDRGFINTPEASVWNVNVCSTAAEQMQALERVQ